MKWKFNIIKSTVIPFEVEADDFQSALQQGQETVNQQRIKDNNPENTGYALDTIPSADQIPWMDDSKYLAKKPKKGKKAEGRSKKAEG